MIPSFMLRSIRDVPVSAATGREKIGRTPGCAIPGLHGQRTVYASIVPTEDRTIRAGDRMRTLLCVLAIVAAFAGDACAQANYPEQPVRIIVGFPPGVAPDVTARLLADKFTESWGKAVVVENVTGAGSNIATDRVAKAAPDGYTLLMGGNSALVISPSLYDKLPYDPLRDFAPISQVFVAANLLVVPPAVPAKTIGELVALLKYMAHVDIQPVAYRGTTAVLPDLLAGRLTMSFANISNALPLVREGKLTAFAASSRRRSAAAPDIPTMAESGYPGFDAVPWFGLLAPAGTPPAVIDKVHRETVRVLALPEVQTSLRTLGLDLIGNSPSKFAEVIKAEIPQWATVIRSAGIRASE
jgi:tripartite-type tricarboxylate transporter receptor subunit TctC